MKKVLIKIWEFLTAVFAGIVIGMIVFWELTKGSINNQKFTVKKVKTKGENNETQLHIDVTQEQKEKKEKHKRRTVRRRSKKQQSGSN